MKSRLIHVILTSLLVTGVAFAQEPTQKPTTTTAPSSPKGDAKGSADDKRETLSKKLEQRRDELKHEKNKPREQTPQNDTGRKHPKF